MESCEEHLCLDLLAVVINSLLFAGDVPDVAGVVILIGLYSRILHVLGGNLFQLLEYSGNSAVDIADGFLRFLIEVLEVRTDSFGCSFLVVGGQELSLDDDDVPFGEVPNILEVLESIPPGEGFVSHKLPKLDDLPSGFPFGDLSSALETVHPVSGGHVLV